MVVRIPVPAVRRNSCSNHPLRPFRDVQRAFLHALATLASASTAFLALALYVPLHKTSLRTCYAAPNARTRRAASPTPFPQRRVAALFEVVVFTASQKIYAERLLDILDPGHELVRHRIYRDSCVVVDGNYLKVGGFVGCTRGNWCVVCCCFGQLPLGAHGSGTGGVRLKHEESV